MSWFNFGNNWGEFVHRRIFMKAINKLKHLIDVNTENITNNHRQIMKNVQDISKNKADIQANSENIDLNKEHILLEQSELDNHSQSLESLSQSVSVNSENIASNSTSLASQSESVENISQSLSATSEIASTNVTSIGSLTQQLSNVAGQSTFTYNILNSASGPHIPQLYNTRFKLVGVDFDNDGKLKEVIFTLQGTNRNGAEENATIPLHANNAVEFTIGQFDDISGDITPTLIDVTSTSLQCQFKRGTDTSNFENLESFNLKFTGKDPVTHETKNANIAGLGMSGLVDKIDMSRSFSFNENGVTQGRFHITNVTAVHANHVGYTITLANEDSTINKTINIPE